MRAIEILAVVEQLRERSSGITVYGWLTDGGRWEASWRGGVLRMTVHRQYYGPLEDELAHMPAPEAGLLVQLHWSVSGEDPVQIAANFRYDVRREQHLTCWPSPEVFDQVLRDWLPETPARPAYPDSPLEEYVDLWAANPCQLDSLGPEVRFLDARLEPRQVEGQHTGVTSLCGRWEIDRATTHLPGLVQLYRGYGSSLYRQTDGSWTDHPPEERLPCLWIHTLRDLIYLWETTLDLMPDLVLVGEAVLTPRIAETLAVWYRYLYSENTRVYLLGRHPPAKSARSTVRQ